MLHTDAMGSVYKQEVFHSTIWCDSGYLMVWVGALLSRKGLILTHMDTTHPGNELYSRPGP